MFAYRIHDAILSTSMKTALRVALANGERVCPFSSGHRGLGKQGNESTGHSLSICYRVSGPRLDFSPQFFTYEREIRRWGSPNMGEILHSEGWLRLARVSFFRGEQRVVPGRLTESWRSWGANRAGYVANRMFEHVSMIGLDLI